MKRKIEGKEKRYSERMKKKTRIQERYRMKEGKNDLIKD